MNAIPENLPVTRRVDHHIPLHIEEASAGDTDDTWHSYDAMAKDGSHSDVSGFVAVSIWEYVKRVVISGTLPDGVRSTIHRWYPHLWDWT